MTFAEAVAKRTQDLLKEKGVSQYRLIKDTCLDKTTIQAIFKKKTKDVKLSTVFVIAEFFGMEIWEFTNCPYFKSENIMM